MGASETYPPGISGQGEEISSGHHETYRLPWVRGRRPFYLLPQRGRSKNSRSLEPRTENFNPKVDGPPGLGVRR